MKILFYIQILPVWQHAGLLLNIVLYSLKTFVILVEKDSELLAM